MFGSVSICNSFSSLVIDYSVSNKRTSIPLINVVDDIWLNDMRHCMVLFVLFVPNNIEFRLDTTGTKIICNYLKNYSYIFWRMKE